MIRVRDSGIGISPELLPHIFDLFTQAERSLDRSQGGLGIGLTLVKRLVGLHGGSVEASSRPDGHGSEFVVRLPLREGGEEAKSGRAGVRESGGRDELGQGRGISRSFTPPLSHSPVQPLKVLVVDDNVDAAETLVDLLMMWGHEAYVAHDGIAGIAAAEEHMPDVVLLDIGLPGMDGYEVAQQLETRMGSRKPRLMALTGYGQDDDRHKTHQAGFDAHLVKPVDLQELQRQLGILAVGCTTFSPDVTRAESPGNLGPEPRFNA